MFLRKKTPIIFIHGIMGSMGKGILKGTAELNFGISEQVYRPLINILESFGYKEDIDLFICYYDWTKENSDSAKNYLIPTIEKAKKKSRIQKVDIISHSMGGIVARAYAQSVYYKNDINKLIMIATPNAGSANAYFFWSGGYLKYKEEYKNILYRLIKSTFIWYVRLKYNRDVDMAFMRDNIPSVGELLPSYDYGNYLISGNKEIDIKSMSIENKFLNKLNSDKSILRKRRIKTYLIVGKDTETVDKIEVIEHNEEHEKWKDGRPIGVVESLMGDGTVICKSVETIKGKTIYVDSDHKEILSNCESELASILNVKKIATTKKEKKFDMIYVIIGKDIDFEVDKEKSSDPKTYSVIKKQMSDNINWTMIKILEENKIEIKINKVQNEGVLVINKANISKERIEEKIMNISNKMSLKI